MNSTGLPGGLPIPPGVSGSLTVGRTTLVDGVSGRPGPAGSPGYTIFIPTSGGSGALTSCTVTVGALPAGLSIVVVNDPVSGTPIACRISGTITAAPGVVSFSVQVQDGSSPVQTATQAFSITVRPEFKVTTIGARPEGRQSSTYGDPNVVSGKSPEPITTDVGTLVAGIPTGVLPLTSCAFAANANFTTTPLSVPALPTNAALTTFCPLSTVPSSAAGVAPLAANNVNASGTFTYAATTGLTVQDSALLDPLPRYATLSVAARTVVPPGSVKNASAFSVIVNPTLAATFVQGTVTPNTNPATTLLDGVDTRTYGVINANGGAPNWTVTGGLGAGIAGLANYGWCVSLNGAQVTAIGLTGFSTSCAAPTAGVSNVKLTSAAAVPGAASFAVDITDAGNIRVPSLTITQGTSTINVRAVLAASFAQAGNTTAASTLLDGVNVQSYGVINANAGAPTYSGVGGLGSGTAGTAAYQWCISVNAAQVTAIGLSGISPNCAAPTTSSPVRLTSASAITGSASYSVQLSDTGNEATPLGTVAAGPSVINVQVTMTATFVQGVVTPNTNPNSTLLDGSTGLSYGVINANAGGPTYTVAGGLGAGAAGVAAYQWCVSVNGAQVAAIGLTGISTNCAAPTSGVTIVKLTSASAVTGSAAFSVQASDTGNAATPASLVTQGTSTITVRALVASFVQGVVTPNTNPATTLLDGVDTKSYGVINANAGAPTWSVVGGLGGGTAGVANYSWCISSGGAAVTTIGLVGISINCAVPTAGVSSVKLTAAAAVPGSASFAVDVNDAGNEAVPTQTITQGTSVINILAALSGSFNQVGNTNANSTLLDGAAGRSYGVINANAGAPTYTAAGGLGSGTAGAAAYQWCVTTGAANFTAIAMAGISTNCAAPTTGNPVRATSASAVAGSASFDVQLTDTGNEATPLSTVTQGTSTINVQVALVASFVQGVVTPNTNPASTLLPGVDGRSYGVINANAGAPKWSVAGGLGAGTAGVANYSWCVSSGGGLVLAIGLSGFSTNCTGPTAGVASVILTSASAVTGVATFSVDVTDAANAATPAQTITQGPSVININAILTVALNGGSPDPTTAAGIAVVGRTYGAPAATDVVYAASGGLPAYVFAFSNTLTTDTNISCTGNSPTPSTAKCNSGGAGVTSVNAPPTTYDLTIDVDDTANEATPGSVAVAATATLTQTYTVNAELVILNATLPNGLVDFTYALRGTASPSGELLNASGGIPVSIGPRTWVDSNTLGVGSTPCSAVTGPPPAGLAVTNFDPTDGLFSGVPTTISAAPTDFTFEVCVFDTANSTTPAGRPTVLPSYTVNIMDTLAAAAGFGTDTLEVFNTGNGSAPGFAVSVPLTAGDAPFGVAVTPDGRKAYVTANGNAAVRVVDTITGSVSSIAFANCTGPRGIAMALVGTTPKAFVACTNRRIAIINAATDTIISENQFGTGTSSYYGVAVTPDDALVYVTDEANDTFLVMDTNTETEIAGSPFAAGVTAPHGIAINGDIGGGGGTNVYIAGSGSDDVIAISTADNTTIVSTGAASISTGAGSAPDQVSVTPDHSRVYVTLNGTDEIAVFDDSGTPSLNSIVALAGGAGSAPFGVTIPPLLTVPVTGLRVFVANSGNDEIEIRNDASPFAANGSSPIALTGGSVPLGVAHIPVPR